MEVIANTNRIMAALIKDGISRRIIFSGKFTMHTPDFSIKEVSKYRATIMKKTGLTDGQFDGVMAKLMSKIEVADENAIPPQIFREAAKIMDPIDEAGTPFIALSLTLGKIPIWTEDRHFKAQNAVKTFTTKELARILWPQDGK